MNFAESFSSSDLADIGGPSSSLQKKCVVTGFLVVFQLSCSGHLTLKRAAQQCEKARRD